MTPIFFIALWHWHYAPVAVLFLVHMRSGSTNILIMYPMSYRYTVCFTHSPGSVYYDWQRCGEALPLFEQALQIQIQALGNDHQSIAVTSRNLAMVTCITHTFLRRCHDLLTTHFAFQAALYPSSPPLMYIYIILAHSSSELTSADPTGPRRCRPRDSPVC